MTASYWVEAGVHGAWKLGLSYRTRAFVHPQNGMFASLQRGVREEWPGRETFASLFLTYQPEVDIGPLGDSQLLTTRKGHALISNPEYIR